MQVQFEIFYFSTYFCPDIPIYKKVHLALFNYFLFQMDYKKNGIRKMWVRNK